MILQCYGDTKKQCLIARGFEKTVRPDQNPVNLLVDSFGASSGRYSPQDRPDQNPVNLLVDSFGSLQRQIQSPGSIRPESRQFSAG